MDVVHRLDFRFIKLGYPWVSLALDIGNCRYDSCHSSTDMRKLRIISLAAVFTTFITLIVSFMVIFLVTVIPYGWPKISFVLAAPSHIQSYIYTLVGVIHFLPIGVSLVMYSLLQWNVRGKMNSIGVVAEQEGQEEEVISFK